MTFTIDETQIEVDQNLIKEIVNQMIKEAVWKKVKELVENVDMVKAQKDAHEILMRLFFEDMANAMRDEYEKRQDSQ